MKLFGWKSAGRAPSRPVLSRGLSSWTGANTLGEWPRGYEPQVRDGYVGNPVAQRAVRLVSESVGSAPVVSSDPAALALVAEKSGGQSLLETAAMHLLLHGNAFVQVLRDDAGAPRELFALRPERVTVEADARGWPVAFLYRAGTAVTRLSSEDARGAASVIHVKTAHPLDDHYGLGCLGAAAGAIAIHNAATRWNKALLDNAARPSGALTYEPGEPGAVLAAEQFARLRNELDTSFSGATNAGRPMLLEGGLKWQALSLSPADMDFVGLKAAAAREIALAFGVPPMLLGLPGDATYANYREANKALWRQSVLPLAGLILDAIAQGLRSHFAGLTLGVDPDRVSALSEDRERLWAQVEAAGFLTLNEKRAAVGFAAIEVPEPVMAPEPEPKAEEPAAAEEGAPVEVKFNPWHDEENGQFTFAGQGTNHGGAAGMSGRSQASDKSRNSRSGTGVGASRPPKPPQDQSHITAIPGYPESGKDSWRSSNDRIFIDVVNEFNRANKLTPDDPRYQYAVTLKAQAMVESGGSREAFLRDPLQVNNRGDEADDKETVTGIAPGQAMSPELSARAALKWIDHKSFSRPKGAAWNSPRIYRGRAFGLRRYNGNTSIMPGRDIEHRDWYVHRVLDLSIRANQAWREANPLIPIKKESK